MPRQLEPAEGVWVWSDLDVLQTSTGNDQHNGEEEVFAGTCANELCHAFQTWRGTPSIPGYRLVPRWSWWWRIARAGRGSQAWTFPALCLGSPVDP
jgi:hypothetical protein